MIKFSFWVQHLSQADPDDNFDLELRSLRKEVQNSSTEILDRDLAEISSEIQFLEDQVRNDIERYSLDEKKKAYSKISYFKRRAEIFKIELDRRNQTTV